MTAPSRTGRKTVSRRKPSPPPVKSAKWGQQALPGSWQLARQAATVLWSRRTIFGAIILIYGGLTIVLVRGLAGGTDVSELKRQLTQAFSGQFGALASSLSILAVLVSSSGNGSSPTAGTYQFFLAVVVSLAIIWGLRSAGAGQAFRARDAYYNGMYPLVPYILVLLVIGLQLLPLLIGSSIYSTVVNGGIAVHLAEKLFWLAVFLGLAGLSLYWLSSSLFALYIVTLQGMTPLRALRSARQLVQGRRWQVLRKLTALPVFLLLTAAVIMLPIILWLTPLAQWVFFVLTMAVLAAVHAYMYSLYRELLNE